MTILTKQFRASFTRRWHTNPDLAHTVDTLAGHGGRVARLMASLWPDSSAVALRWALVHDDGESVVGDVPATHKGAGFMGDAERIALCGIWPMMPNLTQSEKARLKFCDRLDAYMWAKHHAPHTMTGDGWPECKTWIEGKSHALGVADQIDGVL